MRWIIANINGSMQGIFNGAQVNPVIVRVAVLRLIGGFQECVSDVIG